MCVYKYIGKKGSGYGVDNSFKGKRIRERVGSIKKEAAEYLGKKSYHNGRYHFDTLREIMEHSEHRMMRRYTHAPPALKPKAIEMLPEWGAKTTGPKSFPNVFTGTERGI